MKLTKKEIKKAKEYEVYTRSMCFLKEIYSLVEGFPEIEKNNMIDQLRRASTSVLANFSEGCGNCYYGKERDRLNSALGSIAECQSFLDMAQMMNYITKEQYRKLDSNAEIIFEMLFEMIREVTRIIEQNDLVEEEKKCTQFR